MSSPPKPSRQTGGVNITGTTGPVGDIVGRDKITIVTPASELAAILEARGALRPTGTADQQDAPLLRLANRIDALAYWDDIVLQDEVRKELVQIVDKFRFDPEGKVASADNGIQALFHGPRGSGKRLAAKAIAGELRMSAYAINYVAVIGHHPVDTARNLQQLLSAAILANVWLIMHDTELIFGAALNSAIADMLELQGNVIFTTTKLSEIDDRLIDKLVHVVGFSLPNATLRQYIWQRAIPVDLPYAGDIAFQALAQRYVLSGADIRRAVEHAARNAASERRTMTMAHLDSAAARIGRAPCRPCENSG
jgi:AAA+ superfamily predicted ATPase